MSHATFNGHAHQTHATENVNYTKVRGSYKYVPYVFRITGERVNLLPGYTRKEDAEQAVTKLLASNSSLRATPVEASTEGMLLLLRATFP